MIFCYGSPDAETSGHAEASVQTVTDRALAEGKAQHKFVFVDMKNVNMLLKWRKFTFTDTNQQIRSREFITNCHEKLTKAAWDRRPNAACLSTGILMLLNAVKSIFEALRSSAI